MFSSIMCLLSFVLKRLPPPKGHQVLTVYTNIIILLVLSPCSQVGWVERDSNSRRLSQWIYSPSDLTACVSTHHVYCCFERVSGQIRTGAKNVGFADQCVKPLHHRDLICYHICRPDEIPTRTMFKVSHQTRFPT